MSQALYTADAHVVGGRSGRGRTSDGRLEVELEQPKELGGSGEGTNPEQLFAVGYAACFASTISLVGQGLGVDADDVQIDSSVSLIALDGDRFGLGVELQVALPSVPGERAVELVRAAHRACPYSNATRGNVDVTLVVNGARL
ncbi:organic hydroperoxide resistance protein [Cryptosporangium minutisporangium]|uniref:Organic hydroperoxide resistance protein n=1 Tax=Cryptosporangium minutisporangium TaxID=113569 RepID=A0ABP6TC75_9ACTN